MTDIVERLRAVSLYEGYGEESSLPEQAADTIEALQARVKWLEGERDKLERRFAASDFAQRNSKDLSDAAIAVIRELLNANGVPLAAFIDDHVGNAIVQRDEARVRIRALEEALKPFADDAKHYYDSDDDDPFEDWDGNRVGFTVADLRRARDVLKEG